MNSKSTVKQNNSSDTLSNIILLNDKTVYLLKEIREKINEKWNFITHPTLPWITLSDAGIYTLPDEIKYLIWNTKWVTKKVFDFFLVRLWENIETHPHPEWIWEVYFNWNWWIDVTQQDIVAGLWAKKAINAQPNDVHSAEKIGWWIHDFFAVKYEK